MIVVALPAAGLFAAFIAAFGIVDVRGFVTMLLPAGRTAKKPRN